MQLTRFQDWPERLHEFLRERDADPAQWGRNDCIMFAADAVRAMTGEDLAASWRGQYSDLKGALRILREVGGTEGAARSVLGDPIPWQFAQRGDVVLIVSDPTSADQDPMLGLGICVGSHVAGPGDKGVAFLPMALAAKAAWRI